MATTGSRTDLDRTALRVNQALIIGLNLLAFIFNAPWLSLLVALVMAYGTLSRQPGFKVVYSGLLKPRGWVKPDVLDDNSEPHGFAQGFDRRGLG